MTSSVATKLAIKFYERFCFGKKRYMNQEAIVDDVRACIQNLFDDISFECSTINQHRQLSDMVMDTFLEIKEILMVLKSTIRTSTKYMCENIYNHASFDHFYDMYSMLDMSASDYAKEIGADASFYILPRWDEETQN